MKGLLRTFFVFAIIFAAPALTQLRAQSAVEYLNSMGEQMDAIKNDMWDYTSAVAHGKSARKVENKRKELLTTTREAKKKIAALPAYKGDAVLRDSMVSYLALSYSVLNEDYSKIVDMEAVAEQSYDAMEAYLLAQELANDKLDKAADIMEAEQKGFAAKNSIELVADKDKTSQKLESAGKVIKYYNRLYLIFFKSFKQELYLMDALAKKDMNAIEQNNNSLQRMAAEGVLKLDTVKPYKGDATLTAAAREVLKFYLSESKDKMPSVISYFLKRENFEKIKAALDAKPQAQRSKEDVEAYNKAVNDMNAGVNQYNTTNNDLNKRRAALIDNWNKAAQAFLDNNTPKYKK